MGHTDDDTAVTDAELDEALARVIRLLITEAVATGGAPASAT